MQVGFHPHTGQYEVELDVKRVKLDMKRWTIKQFFNVSVDSGTTVVVCKFQTLSH